MVLLSSDAPAWSAEAESTQATEEVERMIDARPLREGLDGMKDPWNQEVAADTTDEERALPGVWRPMEGCFV